MNITPEEGIQTRQNEIYKQLDIIVKAHNDSQVQMARFDERLKNVEVKMTEGFKNINDNFLGRINDLTTSKLSASDFINFRNETIVAGEAQKLVNADFEKRLRFVERYVWVGVTIVGVIEPILIAIFIKYIGK